MALKVIVNDEVANVIRRQRNRRPQTFGPELIVHL